MGDIDYYRPDTLLGSYQTRDSPHRRGWPIPFKDLISPRDDGLGDWCSRVYYLPNSRFGSTHKTLGHRQWLRNVQGWM